MSDWRRLRADEWRRLLTERGVAAELHERLARYLVLLGRWERAVDLVGRVDAGSVIDRHVQESLAGVGLLPETGSLLDVGSGNGFPAFPLLLARPRVLGVLLEPRERRWAFLREAARELSLAADVRRERLEKHVGGGYAALTVRALGVDVWGERAAALLQSDGVLLWWTSRAAATRARVAGMMPVLHSPLPAPERGVIAVWRRCST